MYMDSRLVCNHFYGKQETNEIPESRKILEKIIQVTEWSTKPVKNYKYQARHIMSEKVYVFHI